VTVDDAHGLNGVIRVLALEYMKAFSSIHRQCLDMRQLAEIRLADSGSDTSKASPVTEAQLSRTDKT
jgi:hypothetical protein